MINKIKTCIFIATIALANGMCATRASTQCMPEEYFYPQREEVKFEDLNFEGIEIFAFENKYASFIKSFVDLCNQNMKLSWVKSSLVKTQSNEKIGSAFRTFIKRNKRFLIEEDSAFLTKCVDEIFPDKLSS